MNVPNFVVLDSVYGKFIINRHCHYQAEHLIKTGYPHIQSELKNILSVVATLPELAVVLDVGANAGLVAIPVAQALRQRGGRVIAFEVQRQLYYALCGAAVLNDLGNLTPINRGVGRVRDWMKMPEVDYSKPQDFGLFSLVDQGALNGHSTQVEIEPIDEMGLQRLDFLKIDVEGMELDVLEGAKNTLASYRPWCWVEYWKVDRQKLCEVFKGLGYHLYVMDPLNVLCVPEEKLIDSTLKITAERFD